MLTESRQILVRGLLLLVFLVHQFWICNIRSGILRMACVLSKCILLIYLFMSSDNGWHFDLTILVNWDSNVAFSLSYTGLEKKAPVLDAALLRLLSWLRTLAWDILREIQRFNLIVTPDKYLLGSSIRLWILSNIDSLNHVFYTCKAVNNYTKAFEWSTWWSIYCFCCLLGSCL